MSAALSFEFTFEMNLIGSGIFQPRFTIATVTGCQSGRSLPASHEPDKNDEDACTEEGNNNAAQETRIACDDQPKHEPTDEGPDKAHDQVSNEAVARAVHHPSCKPSSNQSHHQPGDKATGMKRDFCKHRTPPKGFVTRCDTPKKT